MAKVASKDKRIADIALMLEQGLERKQILQKLTKSCKVSARTLDGEIKAAKTVVHERNQQKEAIRQAQKYTVINSRIIARGTIDEDVLLSLADKTNVQDAVMNAVKARIKKYL